MAGRELRPAANLVIQQNDLTVPRTHLNEPTSEPQSLAKIVHTMKMGDRFQRTKPEIKTKYVFSFFIYVPAGCQTFFFARDSVLWGINMQMDFVCILGHFANFAVWLNFVLHFFVYFCTFSERAFFPCRLLCSLSIFRLFPGEIVCI